MTTTDAINYKGKYGGSLSIPITDQADLVFDLAYQTKTAAGKATKLVVGALNVDASPDVGNVYLSDLVSEIGPSLAPLFPEELLDTFGIGGNVIFVINNAESGPPPRVQNKMLFCIGFGAQIAFSDVPLVGALLPPDLLQSEFAFNFLVSFQRFTQSEIKTINSLLEELQAQLLIKPPVSSINYLERGANIGAHFMISLFIQAWLLPLKRTSNTGGGTGGGTRSLAPGLNGERSQITMPDESNNTDRADNADDAEPGRQ